MAKIICRKPLMVMLGLSVVFGAVLQVATMML